MATPRMSLDLGRRGRVAFTYKEIRILVIVLVTAISSGVGYVVRCEVKFATLTEQLNACRAAQKPSPAPVIAGQGKNNAATD